jgi:hypothetical protein
MLLLALPWEASNFILKPAGAVNESDCGRALDAASASASVGDVPDRDNTGSVSVFGETPAISIVSPEASNTEKTMRFAAAAAKAPAENVTLTVADETPFERETAGDATHPCLLAFPKRRAAGAL